MTVQNIELIFDAIKNGDTDRAETLIKSSRVDVSGVRDEQSMIYATLEHQLYSLVPVLIERGADVDLGLTKMGVRPLHLAIQAGSTDLVGLMIAAGADLESETRSGHSPLEYALMYNSHPEIARILLRAVRKGRGSGWQLPREKLVGYHNPAVKAYLLFAGAIDPGNANRPSLDRDLEGGTRSSARMR
jgi:hypothetical protein